jgi:nucleotide-binding universal stress UspA family protein
MEAEPLSPAADQMDIDESELRDRLKRQALAAIEPLVIESGRSRRTEVQVEFGSPHDVIVRIANEHHADVILVGPGTSRSLKQKVWARRQTE